METNDDAKSESGARRFQFSIRRVLVFTAMAAAVLALGRLWPHVVIFVVISALAVWATIRLGTATFRRKWKRVLLRVPVLLAAWLVFYVASVGPVIWAWDKAQREEAQRVDPYSYSNFRSFEMIRKTYEPVRWFVQKSVFSDYVAPPILWYVSGWEDMIEGDADSQSDGESDR